VKPRRYGPPRVRKVRHRDGRWTWIYHLTCACGAKWYVGGTFGAARRAGTEHWNAHWGGWAA
jgi:hypothetical protein